MKHRTLFISPIGSRNKKEAIFKEILSLCPDNNYSSVLYIAPNIPVLKDAKKQFFAFVKKTRSISAYIPFQAWTIKQFAAHMYETLTPPILPLDKGNNGEGLSPLSPVIQGGNIIPERMRTLVLCRILKENNLGYASILSDLFSKIKHYTMDKGLSELTEQVRQLIFEEKTRDRAVKAIEILQAYESFLEENKLIDTDDLLKGCLSIIHQGKETLHLPLKYSLVIDGFFDPTPLETEIINTLIENADRAVISAEENTDLLHNFLSVKEGMKVKELQRSHHRESTAFYSYNSMEDEVEGIARNIRKLIQDGVNPWEITVCFPSLPQYLPMLKRIFHKYGLPASTISCGLSSTKALTTIENIIACIENDYSRNDFLSILTSSCLPAITDTVRNIAVKLSYRAGIIKGKASWLTIEDILKASREISDEEKVRINEFQNEIRAIINALENIRLAQNMTAFTEAFESALHTFGFFDHLKDPPSPPHDTGGYSADIPGFITNIFSELRQFAEFDGPALNKGDSGYYLRFLLQDLAASDEDIDGVRVLPFELAASIESKALFFGGVTEGSFPSRPGIDPVLPEKVKKTLGLPYLEYYLNRQRMYFTRLLNISSFDPYISCHAADGDKIFLPSPFLDWEKTLSPDSLNIFTEEDVLTKEGAALKYKIETSTEIYFDAKSSEILRRNISVMSKRYFRVTDIDYYRKCPFKFYIEKILRLEIEKPPIFEVEYRQWGNLAHKTMEYLFRERTWELDDLEKRLFEALEKSLREIPVGAFWSIVSKEIFRNLLPLLKKQESEIRMQGFVPWLVEEKIEAEISGIRFRGKIDRVDIQKSQKNPSLKKGSMRGLSGDSVILLDYKTGDIDRKSLQLPLYSRMWQELFPEHVTQVGYYSLKEGNVTWYPPKKKSMEEFIQEAWIETESLIGQLKQGHFPAKPVDNECRICDHGALCGKG